MMASQAICVVPCYQRTILASASFKKKHQTLSKQPCSFWLPCTIACSMVNPLRDSFFVSEHVASTLVWEQYRHIETSIHFHYVQPEI